MSRCNNPKECECAMTDNLEYLRCGPCKKCAKRAHDMASSLNLSILEETNTDFTSHHRKDSAKVNAVKTRNQTEDESTWTIWTCGCSIPELNEEILS